jgi:hypothetical protein
VSEDIAYILSVLGSLVVIGAVGVASWLVVEGVYWIYCKIRGRDY